MKGADLVPCWGFLAGLLALALAMGAGAWAKYAHTSKARYGASAASLLFTIAGAALIFGRLLSVLITR